jgi:hypothetical protein
VEVAEGQSHVYPLLSQVPTEVLDGCDLAMSTLVEYTDKYMKLIEAASPGDDAAAAEIIRVGDLLKTAILHIRKFLLHCKCRIVGDHAKNILSLES